MTFHHRLRRLDIIRIPNPVFFVTTNAHRRKPILATRECASILIEEWRAAFPRHGWKVGAYVVMPDHVHFLCAPASVNAKTISGFLQSWKQWTAKRVRKECQIPPPLWQINFFDHLLPSRRSMGPCWTYIRENPVRKGLVTRASDWLWSGEIFPLAPTE
jgi:putative transposase